MSPVERQTLAAGKPWRAGRGRKAIRSSETMKRGRRDCCQGERIEGPSKFPPRQRDCRRDRHGRRISSWTLGRCRASSGDRAIHRAALSIANILLEFNRRVLLEASIITTRSSSNCDSVDFRRTSRRFLWCGSPVARAAARRNNDAVRGRLRRPNNSPSSARRQPFGGGQQRRLRELRKELQAVVTLLDRRISHKRNGWLRQHS